jgi:hypothetical protein
MMARVGGFCSVYSPGIDWPSVEVDMLGALFMVRAEAYDRTVEISEP